MADDQSSDDAVVSVVVETSYANWIAPEIAIYARSEPLQIAQISSLLSGIVESVAMQPGQLVAEGQALAQLSLGTKPEELSEAKAWVKKRSADLAAASKMKAKGYQSQAEYQGIVAALETARRELAQIELQIFLSTIRSPINGVVEFRDAEPGAVISVGQLLGRVVRQDQYLLVANVPESQVHLFSIGQQANAQLASGKQVAGTVRFIATQADEQTRSYRLEVLVDNDQARFAGGATAKLLLLRDKIQVHRVSSNVVTLDEDGVLGVKTVNKDNRVEFWSVDISDAERQTLLVKGLPETTQVIVSGQGFVRAGDLVKITAAASPAKEAAGEANSL
jgi:multidrug efflux system membrane fusion protein